MVARKERRAKAAEAVGKRPTWITWTPVVLFFGRERGALPWAPNPQDIRDTESGTGGSLPHYRQVVWNFVGCNPYGARELRLDGKFYSVGHGDPGFARDGESNNCLIDSLRQCLNLLVDRKRVRADLIALFGNANGRAKVTLNSFLDLDSHWQTIVVSLFRHTLCNPIANVQLDNFCVIGLFTDDPDHGVVLGDRSKRRLVVLNTSDAHFDPCLLKH